MPSGIHCPISSFLAAQRRSSAEIIESLPPSMVTSSVFANAKGIAIIKVLKIGFLSSVRYGNGIVITRLSDEIWSAPSAISIGGVGIGAQAGFELTNLTIMLSDEAMHSFSQPVSLAMGANFSVALGLTGRHFEIDGVASLKGAGGAVAWVNTEGLFLGTALEAFVIVNKGEADTKAIT